MHVDRAFAAMLNGRCREADDDRTQIRLFEPARNIALQNPALTIRLSDMLSRGTDGLAFAGDDQNVSQAPALAAHQEALQSHVRFMLAHAVKIDARFDLDPAAANFANAVA